MFSFEEMLQAACGWALARTSASAKAQAAEKSFSTA
jgi:hypothetical protein